MHRKFNALDISSVQPNFLKLCMNPIMKLNTDFTMQAAPSTVLVSSAFFSYASFEASMLMMRHQGWGFGLLEMCVRSGIGCIDL